MAVRPPRITVMSSLTGRTVATATAREGASLAELRSRVSRTHARLSPPKFGFGKRRHAVRAGPSTRRRYHGTGAALAPG